MTYNLSLIKYLFLIQIRLNILMPFIRIIIKWKINQIIQQDFDAAEKVSKLIEIQNDLLSATVLNPHLKKYPLPISYVRQFLNKLIGICEQLFDSDCLLEDIYPLYAEYISIKSQQIDRSLYKDHIYQDLLDPLCRLIEKDENVGFSTHSFDTFKLPIIGSDKIVSYGTTGLRTWPAALHLLDFLKDFKMDQKSGWNRKNGWENIVELGSGSGLLGIGLIKSGFISNGHYIFTDHSDVVLKYIELNLFANHIVIPYNGLKIFIQKLDWFDHSFFDFSSSISDLIVASEVIFDPKLLDSFIKTLRAMFNVYRDADSSRRYPDCIICCAIRNPNLLNDFQKKLDQFDFEVKEIEKLSRPRWTDKILGQINNLSNDIVIDVNFNALFQTSSDVLPTIIYQINDKKSSV